MKKAVASLLILVIILTILAGCGATSQQGNSPNNTNNPSASANQSNSDASTRSAGIYPKKKVEIEFWYGLGGKLGENVEKFIQEFNGMQDEVFVKGVAQGNYTETYQKLQAGIASKKVPAAVLLDASTIHALANKQVLASMDSLIKADQNFHPEDFVQAFYSLGTINGSQYALPIYGTTQVLYYRKDFFEKEGISPDVLNTWESLSKAAAQLTKKNGNEVQRYGWEPMWGSGNLIDAALSNGAKILSDDGKKVLIDSPEWVEAWEFFRKAIHEDKTMRIHYGGQGWEYWYKTIDDVMQGRAAGYTGSSGDQGDLDFSIIAAHTQPGWEGKPAKPIAGALMVSIPALASPEEQAAAFQWIKFFTSPEKTAEWSMNTGYIAVRKSAREVEAYKKFAEEHPQILVPLKQAETASPLFIDPTGGKITDALSKAADRVEIEGVPAADALRAAKEEAQKALDQVK